MRFKRFTAGIVAAVMAVTAVATPLGDNLPAVRDSVSITAGAATIDQNYVWNKINKLKELFPTGSYFTKNGQNSCHTNVIYKSNYSYCYSMSCPDCKLENVLIYNSKAKNTVVPNVCKHKARYSCCGFATFVFCYIFEHDTEENITEFSSSTYGGINDNFLSKLKPGDFITCDNGTHYAVFLGYDNNNIYLYESNYDSPNQVEYYHARSRKGLKWSKFDVKRSKSYSDNGGDAIKVSDHYKLTSPDGYQTIRKEASTSSANLGSINTGNIVCVTKYSSDNKWGYLTYNGVSGWIRLYYVEKTGSTHSYGSWYTKTSATCTSGGTEERKCSCGATESRSTSALGHSYGSWYTSVNPGCTTAGTEKRVCSRCSNAEYRSTSATGHSYGYWETDREATCTEEGTEVRICSKCNDAEYRTVSALGHNYSSEWTIDKPATCSAEGSKSRHCTRCDAKTEVTAIAKIAHTYTSKVVKPTLTEQGYTLHTCSVCGYSYKDNYTAVRENPSKVTGLAFGARSADYVSLKWNKDANADGYIVEYLSGNKFVKLVDKTSGSSVSHKVTGLEAGTLYKFRIRSYVNENGKRVYGEYSDVLNVRTLPKAMSNLKLGARTDNSISLKWDKNETANGAVVEMYKNGQWVVVATKTSNTAVSHKITGLDASTAYKFRVRAYINDEGGRIYSVYNTTLNEATAPAAVKNFRRTISAKTAIRFNWDKNTTADGYSFEMIKNSKWTTVAMIEDGTATNYSQLKLNPGTAYRFRIRAYKVVNGKKIFSGYSYVNASTAK